MDKAWVHVGLLVASAHLDRSSGDCEVETGRGMGAESWAATANLVDASGNGDLISAAGFGPSWTQQPA